MGSSLSSHLEQPHTGEALAWPQEGLHTRAAHWEAGLRKGSMAAIWAGGNLGGWQAYLDMTSCL